MVIKSQFNASSFSPSAGQKMVNTSSNTPYKANLASDVAQVKGYLSSGVNAAQSGVNAILGGRGVVDNAVQNMNDIASDTKQIGSSMLQIANDAKAQYDAMRPFADILGGYGNDLWGEGQSLSLQAKDIFGQGGALVNLDPNAGGLAGEFIKYWNSLSPDRYVSRAVSDTTSAFSNARGQAMRDLARRGVSMTSGNALEMQRKYLMDYATQLAASKTRARQQGLDAQASQLEKMTSAANTLYGMGNQLEANALSAKGQALSAQKGAADITGSVAQGYTNVGNLQGSAANVFSNVAQMYTNAANLNTNYLNVLQAAYGNLAGANMNAANGMSNLMNTLNRIPYGGGGSVNVIDNTKAAQAARIAAGVDPIARF